jgi:hypothetical protein
VGIRTRAASRRDPQHGRHCRHHEHPVEALDGTWGSIDVVELRRPIAIAAGELAERHGSRGYDAVHLASAELVRSEQAVVGSESFRPWVDVKNDDARSFTVTRTT